MVVTNPEFERAANCDGFDIHLVSQPPNNLDTNVLGLGFFRAIQFIQHEQSPRTVDELIDAVKYAFEVFEPRLLNHVFLSLQYMMIEIMKNGGDNNFKLPHVGKERMERHGLLLHSVEIPKEVLLDCVSSLLRQHMSLHGLSPEELVATDGDGTQSNLAYITEQEESQHCAEEVAGGDIHHLTIA